MPCSRARIFAALAGLATIATAAEARVTRHVTGNPVDATPSLHGPAQVLGGGGPDVDAAIQWMIDTVRGCAGAGCATKLDVVVLRSSGSDGYNEPLSALNGVDSVESLVITARADAQLPEVVASVRNAEIVFFAGGDPCAAVALFKGTSVQAAVESVYARGGGVGGTSAGLAIQGDYVYDTCNGNVTSRAALADPYDPSISFTYDFFRWPFLASVVTDTHFVARDRMGRLLAFLARQIRDGVASNVLGVGVDESTAVSVDKDGLATVMGKGPAYFVRADHVPELCERRRPLTFTKCKLWRIPAGRTFDFKSQPTSGFAVVGARAGKLEGDW
jgi:cyanophycinase